MPNGTYGGVRGTETKVGQRTFVSRPTRLSMCHIMSSTYSIRGLWGRFLNEGTVDISRGTTGASLLLVLLSRIGLAISVPVLPISDAVHCNRSRSALHPPLQCTASVPAVYCLFSRNRLHPPSQTFASAIVNVCIRYRKRLR